MWIQELQAYLYNDVLPLAEPDKDRRVKLVDADAMKVWQAAFTDKSYNPNYGFNYEVLEKIGDASLKLAFNRYLLVRFPDIDQLELSEMTSFYLSKAELSDVGIKLKVGEYARTLLDKNANLYEDIVEAIFGALMEVGDKAYQVGVGYILCYNLVVNIWNDRSLTLSVASGMPKTQIKQIFEKLRWGAVGESWDTPTFKVLANKEAVNQLRAIGINIPTVLGTAQGATKAIASALAYKKALEKLERFGITQAWANQQRDILEFSAPGVRELLGPFEKKYRNEGFVGAAFSVVRTTSTHTYLQLLGIAPNGMRTVLATVGVPGTTDKRPNLTEGKIVAIKDYLNGQV
jgi:dsRNA-specific ribonuclease